VGVRQHGEYTTLPQGQGQGGNTRLNVGAQFIAPGWEPILVPVRNDAL